MIPDRAKGRSEAPEPAGGPMEMRITIPSLIPPNVTINLAMSTLATVNKKGLH